ncbi:hydroxymethylglutaryl coa synthase 1 [Trichuris trichiura]|uniref:arginine--tRNA ligase n=1 Tax=Trichuris trichiura TaxID=36087 RepID=A0A077Z8L8_TRITR|nr:hydroxymethylglutaryl coa synthase 1 [Trichuris trichiura]
MAEWTMQNGFNGVSKSPCRAENVGIIGMDIYFPSMYVDQSELELYDAVSPGKYTIGLGQLEMAVCSDLEDVCSIALTVTKRLLDHYGVSPCEIGRLEVGTESHFDRSKSVKTFLMQLFAEKGNTDLGGIDSINACFGATQALFNAIDWVESGHWDGRYALVIAADIAVYGKGPARCTGGAGAVAMLIGSDAPLVFHHRVRSYHVDHVYDFYKPHNNCEYPTIDGPLSIQSYFVALDRCYSLFCKKYNNVYAEESNVSSFGGILFHTPYSKLVQKSLARLVYTDLLRGVPLSSLIDSSATFDFTELSVQSKDPSELENDKILEKKMLEISRQTFASKTEPSLWLSRRIGNISASDELPGQRLLLFSYGSGYVACMFSMEIRRDAHSVGRLRQILKTLDISMDLLEQRSKVSPEMFHRLLDERNAAVGCAPYAPPGSIFKNCNSFIRCAMELINLRNLLKCANKDNLVESVCKLKSGKLRLIVEYSSPNIAKPFHVGHLRSTLMGRFAFNVLRSAGHNVTAINYLGDWGTQFGMIVQGLRLSNLPLNDLSQLNSTQLAKAYIFAHQANDPLVVKSAREFFTAVESGSHQERQLWQSICSIGVAELEKIYKQLGAHFDSFERESQYAEEAKECVKCWLARNALSYDEDGLVGFKTGGRFLPVCKSDGSTLYIARDLAAAIARQRTYQPDKIYYVVDSGQAQHFDDLKMILSGVGFPDLADKLFHVKFGKIRNTSTRQGKGVLVSDLLNEGTLTAQNVLRFSPTTKVGPELFEQVGKCLALTALIVRDFKQRRQIDYDFCWEKALQAKGATGYQLQATHARLTSLCEKFAPLEANVGSMPLKLDEPEAVALMEHLSRIANPLLKAYSDIEPYPVVQYLFRLCSLSNRAHKRLRIADASTEQAVARYALFSTARAAQFSITNYRLLRIQMLCARQLQHLARGLLLPGSACQRWKHDFVAPEWNPENSKYGPTPEKWQYYDNIVWPPNCDDGKKPGEVFHCRENVKYTEAICRNSLIVKGLRRHARERWGTVHYRYCNVFVRLEEGKPDVKSRFPMERLGWHMLEKYLESLRNRRIDYHP